MYPRLRHKEGSSMVESCIVMVLLCLVLFGLLNVSYVVSSRNVLDYASIATARAASVGLNGFMLKKISHFDTIPTAGPVRMPGTDFKTDRPQGGFLGAKWSFAMARKNTPKSELGEYETQVHEGYLLSDHPNHILDYDNWSNEGDAEVYIKPPEYDDYDVMTFTLAQRLPLVLPFSRVFFGNYPLIKASRGGKINKYPGKEIDATTYIEDHSKYYLKDMM